DDGCEPLRGGIFRHRAVALDSIPSRNEGTDSLAGPGPRRAIRRRDGVERPMILCVTLNPCLDKTLTVPPWRPGDLVRGTAVGNVVGGKGNNVARALRRLGRQPRPATFLGGATGAWCEAALRNDDGLEPLVVPTDAPTRVILTVRTQSTAEQSAFFDPHPTITRPDAEALVARPRQATV